MSRLYLSTNSNKAYYRSPEIVSVPWTSRIFDVGTSFMSAAFSPDGTLMAIGGNERGRVYTTSSLEQVYEYPQICSPAYSNAYAGMFFSPDSQRLHVNSYIAPSIKHYTVNLSTESIVATSASHEAMIDLNAAYHVIRYQVDGAGTVYLKLRDATSPYAEVDIGIPQNGLRGAAISDAYLAVIYYENSTDLGAAITIYDLALGAEKTTGLPPEIQPEADPATGRWNNIGFSHDGRYLAGMWRSSIDSIFRVYIFDTSDWSLVHSATLTSSSSYGSRPIFVPGQYNFFLRRSFYFDWDTKAFSALPSISGNSEPAVSYTDMVQDYSITVRDVDGVVAERAGVLIDATSLEVIRSISSDVDGLVQFAGIGSDSNSVAALMFDNSSTAQRNDILLQGLTPDV